MTGAGNKLYPTAIPTSSATTGKTFIAVSAGSNYDLALASDGTIYGWGTNTYGCLGNGTTTTTTTPVAVNMSGAMAGKTITAIAAGEYHAMALASDGTVFAWGYGIYGQLGNNTAVSSSVPVAVDMTGALAGKTVTAIAAGLDFSMALTSDHLVFSWGVLRANDPATPVTGRVPVLDNYAALSGKTFTAIAAGVSTSYALGTDGNVYSWGYNVEGEAGVGTTSLSVIPTAVTTTGALAGKTVVALAGGAYNALVLTADGGLYSWGYNLYGSVGDGTTTDRSAPVAVNMSGVLAGKTITAITAGAHSSTVLASDGKVYAWGYGDYIGNGSTAFGTATANPLPIAVNTSSTPGQLGLTSDLFGQTVVTLGAGPTGAQTIVIAQGPVVAAPVITTQPANQTVTVGASATFTVVASGSSLSYQWSKGGSTIAGATSASYTIASTALTDAGSYSVVVSNSGGSTPSNAATLTVNLAAPAITTQPANRTVIVGGSATFTVVASGSSLSYQWSKGASLIAGATSASYTIASCVLSDAGSYSVTVSNSGGSVPSNSATLTVNSVALPIISLQPASQSIAIGGTVNLAVTATGGALSYQWYKGGTPIGGATASTLSFVMSSAAADNYSVTVTNAGGSTPSATAAISVLAVGVISPVITLQPASQTVPSGSPVTLSVTATGNALSYQWYFGAAPMAGATDSTLSLIATPAIAGSYAVTVSNAGGSIASSSATLTVSTPPVITAQPTSQLAAPGSPVAFVVGASGGALSYQWYFGGVAIPGATDATLNLIASAASAGDYTVIVSNAGGSTGSAPATLSLRLSRLVNASIRGPAGVGADSLILGFVFSGPSPKPMLIRGIGPTLVSLGVPNAVLAPQLNLWDSSNKLLATNSGWAGAAALKQAFTDCGAFPLPAASADAALLQTLTASSYTAQVIGSSPTVNVALVEAYDANDADVSTYLKNASGRAGGVGTGSNQLIAGFVIAGNTNLHVLVRGIGPALASLGVLAPLTNPVLTVYDSGGKSVGTNDDWAGDATLAADFAKTGAFPLVASSKDAALDLVLAPGSYTAVVSSSAATTGIALVEIYSVP